MPDGRPRRLFDSHCHIIDHRFPIVANQGYVPPAFPLEAYLAAAKPLGVEAGAIVSGSFQANDQTYLMDVLSRLGAGWVGVTQIPDNHPDSEIAKLGALGVRAVRFNMFRGRIESVDSIVALACAAMRSRAGMPRSTPMPRPWHPTSASSQRCRSSASTISA
jgi:predicted TIM-barrel fold metal-dependent hydrolase